MIISNIFFFFTPNWGGGGLLRGDYWGGLFEGGIIRGGAINQGTAIIQGHRVPEVPLWKNMILT